MTLSKETLTKTANLLQEEIESLNKKQSEIITSIRKHSVGNFHVTCIDKRWLGSKDEQQYKITFGHKVREIDLDFRIFSNGTIDRVSWSSWGFTNITPEELKKSINYIDSVKEMLTIMSDTSVAQGTIDKVVKIKIEELSPLQEKTWEVEAELRNVQLAIHEIEKEEQFEKAIELFKDTVYFYDTYQIAKRNYIRSVKIEQKKDKYFAIMDDVRKKVDKQEILCMYNHAMKMNVKQERNQDIQEYNSEGYYSYYKTVNVYLSREESVDPVWIDITKEEYKTIKGY